MQIETATEMEPCEFHELRIYGRELRRKWYIYGPHASMQSIYQSFLAKQKRFLKGKETLRAFRSMKLPSTISDKKFSELRRKTRLENDLLTDDTTLLKAQENLQTALAGDEIKSFLYQRKDVKPETEETPKTLEEIYEYLDILQTELKDERIFQRLRNHEFVLLSRDYEFMTREFPDREKYLEIYIDDIDPIMQKKDELEKMVAYGNLRITNLTRKIDDAKITRDLLTEFGTAYPGENDEPY